MRNLSHSGIKFGNPNELSLPVKLALFSVVALHKQGVRKSLPSI